MSEQAAWDAAFALFVERDWAQIRAAVGDALDADWPAIGAAVMTEEREELRLLCLRTLVLELNCARMLGQLAGDTPEARFAGFVERFRSEAGWAALFEEYAVLGATVDGVRRGFRAQVIELFERLACDRDALAAIGVAPGAKLVGASASLSDPHRGGRCVWKLELAGGARAMYKPKPLAIDARFQWVIGLANAAIERGELHLPPLRALAVLDRGDYGWVEFVTAGPCADAAAAARFYKRQGALLALLHALLGTDMHYENVIACGEHPVIVDYETLFHPLVASHPSTETARGLAEVALERSALRVGLLPWRSLQQAGKGGVNVGAVGDGAAQALPFAVPRWEGEGRDDMRLVEKQIALPAAENLPRVGGEVAPFHAHADAIARGFDTMLGWIAANRAAWIAPGGILGAFAGDTIRYILRPTRTYTKVLQATAHPDHLRTRASADGVRAILDHARDAVAIVSRLRDSENLDLEARDVPYFHGVPASADVRDSRDVRFPDSLVEAPLETVRALVAGLDDAEVERQRWFVRASLSAAAIGQLAPRFEWRPAAPGARALDFAAAIGDRLASQALDGTDGATWIGIVDCAADAFTVAPLGADLYDGVAGIALFFAALGRATGEARFLKLADRAGQTVRASLRDASPHGGGFVGAPSRLYALAHVSAALGDSLELPAVAADAAPDVIYGAAGSILALLSAAGSREGVRAPILAAVGALERTAIVDGDTASWACAGSARALLGFSHGTSGIAYALARVAASPLFDDVAPRCASLAAAALRYERARFDAVRGNWPDFRAPDAAGRSVVAWCHGAPGVVLSRLAPAPDAAALAELEAGIATTLASRGDAHSLCHGAVGNLAIVARAAHRLDRADWRAAVEARVPALLDAIARGPSLDAAFAPSAPGLMTGLAGVGMGLLMLADPSLPSVLALD